MNLDIQAVIGSYKDGMPLYKCVKTYKVSEERLKKLLLSNSILPRSRSESFGVTKDMEKYIIEQYTIHNKSQSKISKEVGITHESVSNILKRTNTEITDWKYIINEDYFEKIDSPDKAYFLGWLISDGCNKGNGIRLTIQERDKEILENFKKYVNYEGPLYKKISNKENLQNYMSLDITNSKIAKDVEKWGVVKKKAKLTYFPKIEEKYYPYLIRGVFEGDGWISESRKTFVFGISGSKQLMEEIQEVLRINCNIETNPIRKTSSTYVFSIAGYSKVTRVFNFLYKNHTELKLSRKYNKFLQINSIKDRKYILYNNEYYTVAEMSKVLYDNFNIPIERTKKRLSTFNYSIEDCFLTPSEIRIRINKTRVLKRNKQ